MFNSISHLLRQLADGTGKDLVLAMSQPLTANQMARKLDVRPSQASALMERLNAIGLVQCLNPFARSSRVYWHTLIGEKFHNELCQSAGISAVARLSKNNWSLYGSTCFNHRSTVIKMLTRPMPPAEIKRQARLHDQRVSISASNVRDVIRYLHKHGIVQPVHGRKRAHPSYELTPKGEIIQQLMTQAEVKT